MLLVSPAILILIALLAFKPVRFVVGWILFAGLAIFVAFWVFVARRHGVL
jgi:hypothetical protein